MYLKVVSPSANTNSHVLLFKERKYQYDLECSIAYRCCFSSRGVLYVIDSFMHAGMIVSRAQDQGLKNREVRAIDYQLRPRFPRQPLSSVTRSCDLVFTVPYFVFTSGCRFVEAATQPCNNTIQWILIPQPPSQPLSLVLAYRGQSMSLLRNVPVRWSVRRDGYPRIFSQSKTSNPYLYDIVATSELQH